MDVRVGLWRKLSAKELMLLNCGVGEDSWESLGLQGDPGDQSWVFIGRTDFEAEAPILWPPDVKLTHLKSPWCWERLRGGGEGDNRGWDGWMVSLTRWTWVCVNSGSWWWTGSPGVLRSKGSQRFGHDWVTQLTDWTRVTWGSDISCLRLFLHPKCRSLDMIIYKISSPQTASLTCVNNKNPNMFHIIIPMEYNYIFKN